MRRTPSSSAPPREASTFALSDEHEALREAVRALAAALVIEEVARACASSSLIPAVNKLGTMPR
jgi:hypothetical protein